MVDFNLRVERQKRGLTQEELARRSGLGLQTVRRAELGNTISRQRTVNRIWNALECNPVEKPLSLAEAIKQSRKAIGMTQKELAFRNGISLSTILNAESGDNSPQPPVIRAMLDAGLNIDLTFIVPKDLSEADTFGEYLRIARQRQLLTVSEVQTATGIAKRTLVRIENDQCMPRFQTLALLAGTYELAMQDLPTK